MSISCFMISRWKDIKASREIGVVVAVVEIGGPDIPDTRCYGGSSREDWRGAARVSWAWREQ